MTPWIVWDEYNTRHILGDNSTRSIEAEEVEEALRDRGATCRRMGRDRVSGRRRNAYRGRTEDGRKLTVIVEVISRYAVRPITAWEQK